MKTRRLKRDNVNIIALRGSKNKVKSEVPGGQLHANDIDVMHENEKWDDNLLADYSSPSTSVFFS